MIRNLLEQLQKRREEEDEARALLERTEVTKWNGSWTEYSGNKLKLLKNEIKDGPQLIMTKMWQMLQSRDRKNLNLDKDRRPCRSRGVTRRSMPDSADQPLVVAAGSAGAGSTSGASASTGGGSGSSAGPSMSIAGDVFTLVWRLLGRHLLFAAGAEECALRVVRCGCSYDLQELGRRSPLQGVPGRLAQSSPRSELCKWPGSTALSVIMLQSRAISPSPLYASKITTAKC